MSSQLGPFHRCDVTQLLDDLFRGCFSSHRLLHTIRA